MAGRDRRAGSTGHFRGELRYVRADGTSFPAEISSDVFTDDAGERTCIVVRDITARVAADAVPRERAVQLVHERELVAAHAATLQWAEQLERSNQELHTERVDGAAYPVPPPRLTADMVTDGSGGRCACVIVGGVSARIAADASLRDRTEQLAAGLVQGDRQALIAQRDVREVNVSIVHGLVAAKMALRLGAVDQAPRLLDAASRAAGGWARVQLRSADGPRPGSLVSGRAGCIDAGEVSR